jgi:hypothetical protein
MEFLLKAKIFEDSEDNASANMSVVMQWLNIRHMLGTTRLMLKAVSSVRFVP